MVNGTRNITLHANLPFWYETPQLYIVACWSSSNRGFLFSFFFVNIFILLFKRILLYTWKQTFTCSTSMSFPFWILLKCVGDGDRSVTQILSIHCLHSCICRVKTGKVDESVTFAVSRVRVSHYLNVYKTRFFFKNSTHFTWRFRLNYMKS